MRRADHADHASPASSAMEPADPPPADEARPPARHRRRLRGVLLALALAVILDVVLCAAGAAAGGYEALALRRQVVGVTLSRVMAEVPALDGRLGVARVAFGAARACWWPWRPLAGAVAALGGPARVAGAIGPLLDLAADGSAAGSAALDGLQPALAALSSGHHAAGTGPGQAGERLLAGLQRGQPSLRSALSNLRQADADWAALGAAHLPAAWRIRLQPLAHALPAAEDALRFSVAAPSLLGATRPRYYLLVPENPWDLRGTGGFAGTAALLQARHGRLTLLAQQASDAVDEQRPGYVPPPLPLIAYEHFANWYYRDANWSPDFPTSAALMRYLYWVGQKRLPDGVIAFDSALLGPLLQLTGPVAVSLPGTSTRVTLTAANGVRTLDYYTNFASVGGKAGVVDKAFTAAAYHAVFARLRDLRASDLARAARILDAALHRRDLLIWLPDPAIAPILARHGWDGAVNPTRADYLYVVDSNVHGNKINARIREAISYRAVVRPDRALLSTLTITYINGATPYNIPPPQNNTLYEDFVRVYVPLGSRLIRTAGFTTPWPTTRADNKQVFAGYLRLPSGRHATVTLTYLVPPNALMDARAYHLTIQKQPGTDALPLSVELRAGEPGIRIGGMAAWSWRGRRAADVDLTASLSGGHARPRPLVYDATTTPRIGPGRAIEPGLVLPSTLPPPPHSDE